MEENSLVQRKSKLHEKIKECSSTLIKIKECQNVTLFYFDEYSQFLKVGNNFIHTFLGEEYLKKIIVSSTSEESISFCSKKEGEILSIEETLYGKLFGKEKYGDQSIFKNFSIFAILVLCEAFKLRISSLDILFLAGLIRFCLAKFSETEKYREFGFPSYLLEGNTYISTPMRSNFRSESSLNFLRKLENQNYFSDIKIVNIKKIIFEESKFILLYGDSENGFFTRRFKIPFHEKRDVSSSKIEEEKTSLSGEEERETNFEINVVSDHSITTRTGGTYRGMLSFFGKNGDINFSSRVVDYPSLSEYVDHLNNLFYPVNQLGKTKALNLKSSLTSKRNFKKKILLRCGKIHHFLANRCLHLRGGGTISEWISIAFLRSHNIKIKGFTPSKEMWALAVTSSVETFSREYRKNLIF